ncbi:MAG: porin family protein, partial [Prevotella conceptionensis]
TYINDNYSKDDHSSTTHRFGINAGAGADYELTEDLSLTAETKFQLVNGFNQAVASIGIVYNF